MVQMIRCKKICGAQEGVWERKEKMLIVFREHYLCSEKVRLLGEQPVLKMGAKVEESQVNLV